MQPWKIALFVFTEHSFLLFLFINKSTYQQTSIQPKVGMLSISILRQRALLFCARIRHPEIKKFCLNPATADSRFYGY